MLIIFPFSFYIINFINLLYLIEKKKSLFKSILIEKGDIKDIIKKDEIDIYTYILQREREKKKRGGGKGKNINWQSDGILRKRKHNYIEICVD